MRVRITCSIIGAFMLSFGIATIVHYNLGMAALDTYIVSIQMLLGVTFSTSLMIIQFTLLAILLIFKNRFKLTWPDVLMPFVSVIVISSLIEISSKLVRENLTSKPIWFLVVAFFIYSYGITLLVRGNIFLAPSDKVLIVMERFLKHSYGFYKVATDILLIIVSFIIVYVNDFDLRFSVFTLFLTFFTGIFIMFFTKVNKILFKL